MEDIILMLLLQLLLIALNAFFACAEIAVLSINEAKLEKLEEEGNEKARKLRALTDNPAKFLSAIQVAITLSGFIGSALASEHFSDYIVKWFADMGVTIPLDLAVVAITLILSFFTLVFGELVPKRVAMKKSEKMALRMAPVISFIAKIFAPLVFLLTVCTNGVLRLMRIDPKDTEEKVSEEDIKIMVDASEHIDTEEKELIQNIFEFDDMTAGEIATHRTDVTILWAEDSVEEWDKVIREVRHTRYPICTESVDNVVGILNTRDYFILEDKSRESVMQNAVKPVYFVPQSIKADVLFKNMKETKNSIAVVLDEYGGMFGVITMNDLIEQLVGEFNTAEPDFVPDIEQIGTEDAPEWRIQGVALLSDVNSELSISLSSEDCDTFGGYIFCLLGLIPEDGSTFTLESDGLIINVNAVEDHQIISANVKFAPVPEGESEE